MSCTGDEACETQQWNQNGDLSFALPSSKAFYPLQAAKSQWLYSQHWPRQWHGPQSSDLSLSQCSFHFTSLAFPSTIQFRCRKQCNDLPQSPSYLFGVASIDDYAALRSGSHLTSRSWSRSNPWRSQLAPSEGVQVEGIDIIVIDVISKESKLAHHRFSWQLPFRRG